MKKHPRQIPIASAMMLRTDDFKLPKFVQCDNDPKRIVDALEEWEQIRQKSWWQDRLRTDRDKHDLLDQRYATLKRDLNAFQDVAVDNATDAEVVQEALEGHEYYLEH